MSQPATTDDTTVTSDSPPTQPVTHVLLVVDRSGSMHRLADDVRGGFNAYLADLADQPGTFQVTVTLFHTTCQQLCVAASPADAPRLNTANYTPGGNTALYDAIGDTVYAFEERVTLGPADRVLCVIQTDGQENSSREYRASTIKELITAREAGGQWTFIYLGAGPDAWNRGEVIGTVSVNTTNDSAGVRNTYRGLTQASAAYAAGASSTATRTVLADAVNTD